MQAETGALGQAARRAVGRTARQRAPRARRQEAELVAALVKKPRNRWSAAVRLAAQSGPALAHFQLQLGSLPASAGLTRYECVVGGGVGLLPRCEHLVIHAQRLLQNSMSRRGCVEMQQLHRRGATASSTASASSAPRCDQPTHPPTQWQTARYTPLHAAGRPSCHAVAGSSTPPVHPQANLRPTTCHWPEVLQAIITVL